MAKKVPLRGKKKKHKTPIAPSSDVIDVTPVASKKKKKKPISSKGVNLPARRVDGAIVQASSELVPTNDPLITYLNEIRKYPLLTPEEERDLAIKYKEKGDKIAAEKLVTSNLRFVVKVAAEYSRFGAKMIDLIQEGNVGLMHAVREFNPYKGVRLITYAVWWIKGYIREYLMRQHSLVRVGTTQAQKKLYYNLQREQREIESLGEEAGIDVLSERLGVSEKDVRDMKQRLEKRDVSLDQPMDDDNDSSLMSIQKDIHALSPEEALMNSEQTELLKEKLDTIMPQLNEKERYILESRLLADEPLTLQEVGDKYGITRERARQLESRVLDKIRKAFLEAAEPTT
jgi:RNA polymerase sigma-32 factor